MWDFHHSILCNSSNEVLRQSRANKPEFTHIQRHLALHTAQKWGSPDAAIA
jgi:hypothetical protein